MKKSFSKTPKIQRQMVEQHDYPAKDWSQIANKTRHYKHLENPLFEPTYEALLSYRTGFFPFFPRSNQKFLFAGLRRITGVTRSAIGDKQLRNILSLKRCEWTQTP
jgi:hypothetical protein